MLTVALQAAIIFLKIVFCGFFCLDLRTFKNNNCRHFFHEKIIIVYHPERHVRRKKLSLIGSAVLTLSRFKQTNKQTSKEYTECPRKHDSW